jgi:anti-sigma regulatory factor (Ser/Thr protein kinase)
VLETLQVDTTATAVMARLEQTPEERRRGTTRVVWSNAGHPPPVVVTPDGDVRVLAAEHADLLLGLDPETERAESQVALERGSTVLLFTDGLVERRGEDLEAGFARLRRELRALVELGLPLDALCDQLLHRMVPTRREDDVALVAVRLHPQVDGRPAEAGPGRVPAAVDPHAPEAEPREWRARFPAAPESVPEARRFVREVVRGRFGRTLVEDAELCVSELAANAALHGGGGTLEVTVRADPGAVTIAVADEDGATARNVVPSAALEGDHVRVDAEPTAGRGLGIVSVVSTTWGVEREGSGKRVWATLVDRDGGPG